ncbi:coiled-coil-helix-coiled-coil-helix domain-containing protein 7 isoform X2 [Eurytemora carolleeae]|uniref:coiled-coil-helix-coiled-coil-helix domain-containing protein 7 isoform X2 n=1 Tax=Eurytemora carolleeae TaxID=1294199 RepID=UPI000C75FF9A|nr:coiled-coil-helix-coiled-coil-helix domain-containing protein 7 isoform X2 [Eurytemora carolleeae]|eukprot:XP_023345886.1 coiled-coil-helix-coiled-coil-helix domain-containing protein 7-like isoform X2 [Eurytemora affinis]
MSVHSATKTERQNYSVSKLNYVKDPCFSENQIALQCLAVHHRAYCSVHQENYRVCRDFWKKRRRKRGETPYLPPPAEREEILRIHRQNSK